MLTTTATEMQNNFGKYLNSVIQGQEIIITKNGTPVAKIIPQNQTISYLTDSLTGILKEESLKQVKEETLKGKYGYTDIKK